MSQAVHLRKYGVEAVVNFELYEIDGVDLKTDAADGGTDCNIMKDQGAEATCDNDFVDEGSGYSITITATEMEAAQVTLYIIDSATKVYLDKVIHIETYGNASAMHAMDFDDAVRGGLTALPNAVADAAGGLAISDAGGQDIDAAHTASVAVDTLTKAAGDGDLAAVLLDTAELGAAVGASISADIADLPTVAEFEARTIVAANYVVVGDTLARVTLTDTVTTYTGNTKQTADNNTLLTAIDTLTKAAGDGDLAAIKVIIDALTAAGAAKLALGATTMITGIVSWDNTNATTTVIYSSDIIEATADHYNGRLFVPTSGVLVGQYTEITDYALDTGEGKFTVTAMTEAPADNTTFLIL